MKRTTYFILFLILNIFSLSALAENRLSIPTLEIGAGKEASVPISLSNDSQVVAVQFRLILPKGFTMSDTTHLSLSDRKTNHTVTVKHMSGTEYLIVMYSITNHSLRGNSGVLFRLPVLVPDTCTTGHHFSFQFSEVILSARNGVNLESSSDPGGLLILDAPRPDFNVENIQAGSNTLIPGQNAVISWTVRNSGNLKSSAGWSENVSLIAENGETAFLGTVYYDQPLEAGGVVSRQATFNLSQTIGLEGNAIILVKVSPYTGSGELPASQINNSVSSAHFLTVAKLLTMSLSKDALGEKDPNAVLARIYRSGSRLTEQSFAVQSNNASRLNVPAIALIAAGSSSGIFYINAIDNSYASLDTTISVSVSGNGYQTALDSIVLVDNEIPALTMVSSKDSLVEGETFTMTVSRELVTGNSLAVLLSTDVSGRMNFTSQLLIPANEKSITVDVTTIDDAMPSLTALPMFTATAPGYNKSQKVVKLFDNDIPAIQLSFSPGTVSESAGYQAVVGVVKRQGSTTNALNIQLTSNAGGGVYFSSNMIGLEKGVSEKKFTIGVVDNDLVDGSRTYTIQAAVYLSTCGCAATGTDGGVVQSDLTILDDDGPALKLTASQTMLPEGKTGVAHLKLTRNTSSTEALSVTLSSDHPSDLSMNTTIDIPVGSTSINIPISALKNDISEGDRTVIINANASGFTKGVCWVMITDQTLTDATVAISSLSTTTVLAKSTVDVTVQVRNEGVVKLPSYQSVDIYYTKDSLNLVTTAAYLLNTFYTTKDIMAGKSEPFMSTVTLPDLTGKYYLFAVVNAKQSILELSYLNNTSIPVGLLLQAPYTATVNTDKTIYKPNDLISFSGVVVARGNSEIAGVPVEIYMINNGDRQTLTATTDANGAFKATYKSFATQMGHFQTGACYPGEGLKTEQKAFDIYGLRRTSFSNIVWEVLVNEENTGEIELINPGNLTLTNLKTTITSDTSGYILTFDPITSMTGGSKAKLTYHLKGTKPSTGNDWQRIYFQVVSDEGATLDLTTFYFARTAKASLKASISSIQTTMCKGVERTYTFTISNQGKGNSGPISVLIPDVSWLSLLTPATMPSLASSESATISLKFAPGNEQAVNVPIYGTIGINCENGTGIPLPFRIETVSEQTGSLLVDVCDEYTYYTTEAPHLAGATVVVKHPYTQAVVAQGVTNDKGIFAVDSLLEGYYTIVVTAAKHDTYTNSILIDPGKTTSTLINLSFQAITYTWNVVETEVVDEYTVEAIVKYETNVPTPVVVTESPDNINADSIPLGQSLIYNIVVTNKGLITAKDVNITIPSGLNTLTFEALTETHFDLKPQSSMIIPVKVTKIAMQGSSIASKLRSASSTNGLLDGCSVQTITIYYWDCGLDRKWHQFSKDMKIYVCLGSGGSSSGPGGGGWGGWGYPSFPGGGFPTNYVPSSETSAPSANEYDCEPCQNRFFYKMSMCLFKRVPILGQVIEIIEVIQEVQEVLTDGTISIKTVISFIPKVGEKIVGYLDLYSDCIKPMFEDCVPGDFGIQAKRPDGLNKLQLRSGSLMPDYIKHYQKVLHKVYSSLNASESERYEVFADSAWLKLTWSELNTFWEKLILLEGKVDTTSLAPYKPQSITDEQFATFLDRWNNSQLGIASPNKIDQTFLRACYDTIATVVDYAHELGYSSISEMFTKETDIYTEKATTHKQSVCATITLKFAQSVTMTRQAFRGTLTIFNGHETAPMQQVKLNLIVQDASGNQVSSHEFQINTESVDKLTAIDGTGKLDAQETGTATILFIPTKYAAPTIPQEYSFGGKLSYLDPFTGTTVERDLYPVTLTVKPSPDLSLTYFMQRDVLGDDALTTDVVESMEPAEFSLLINNKGYGDATKVNIHSSQPEIIDNQKGLLIDFKIIGSSLNGAPSSFGITDINFGTIPAGKCTYGQWWFTSTLLGHFVDYDISLTHGTSYDNPDLTLISDVSIHQLIRSIQADSASTIRAGFMVDDQVDGEDMPDILYLTDGTTREVSLTTNVLFTKNSETVYTMKVTPTKVGWTYGVFEDPVLGKQKLLSVTRTSDGKSINLRNIWQTDRTLLDGREPLNEFRLHFADDLKTAQTYTLTFEPRRDNVLKVEAFGGVPVKVSETPVGTVTVKFNRPIADSTFTWRDLRLNCQGEQIPLDSVTVNRVDSVTFALNLTSATTLNGYYVLTVQAKTIKDAEGFTGEVGKETAWNQYLGNKVPLILSIQPTLSGVVTPDSVTYTYGSTVLFKAKPNKGYRFKSWMIKGETLSTDSTFTITATESKTIVANFENLFCNLTLSYKVAQGSVTGAETGVYNYGSVVKLFAKPALNYRFTGWVVNGVTNTDADSITLTLKETKTVEALFTSTLFSVDQNFGQGWNWMSFNFSNAPFRDPRQFLSPIMVRTLKLLSSNDELYLDPVLGLTGGISSMSVKETYKLDVNSSCVLNMTGSPYTPAAMDMNLSPGWNWIGYLPTASLTPSVALAGVQAQTNEVIKNQTDFSIYSGSDWVGTLDLMTPGQGFMYFAHSSRTFQYQSPANLQGTYVQVLRSSAELNNGWICNVRQYPDNMTMIIRLYLTSLPVDPDEYTLAAFVGEECRGIGKTVGNYCFITVYGQLTGETLTFKVVEKLTGKTRTVDEYASFGENLIGSLASPLRMNIGSEITNLGTKANNFILYPNPVKDRLYISSSQPEVKEIRIYQSDGRLLFLYDGNDYLKGVDVSSLSDGLYIITLSTSKGMFHQRFVKKGGF